MLVLTAEQAAAVDARTIDEVGIPGVMLMETAGRAVLRVVLEFLGSPGLVAIGPPGGAPRPSAGAHPFAGDPQPMGAHSLSGGLLPIAAHPLAGGPLPMGTRSLPGGAFREVLVLAGPGNNGGDGFVVARALALRDIPCRVCFLGATDRLRGDAAFMYQLLRRCAPGVPVTEVHHAGEVETALGPPPAVIVDALFGTGLKRPLAGAAAVAVDRVNSWEVPVVSVDIPSGVNGSTGEVPGAAIRATVTVAIGFLKRGLLLYPGADLCGRLLVAEIGFPHDVAAAEGDGVVLAEPGRVASWLPHRPSTAHKGSTGKVLLVAGSAGMVGAAMLATRAALRSGAGLVVLAVPQSIAPAVQGEVWEALTLPLPDGGRGWLGPEALGAVLEAAVTADVVAVGPGLGRRDETLCFVQELLAQVSLPVVIDADALRAVRQGGLGSGPVAVTPHPGEMSTLLGWDRARIVADPIAAARECAQRFGVVALLKGAHTAVASPDGRVYLNGTGNAGMACGGMGDVLTGAAAGFVAQGMESFHAVTAAAFVHGLAGDMAAAEVGERGLLARDVAERLPAAVDVLRHRCGEIAFPRPC